MTVLDGPDLGRLYRTEFDAYRNQDWAKEWRRNYSEQVRRVQEAQWDEWIKPQFQELLWDSDAVASIGP